MASSPGLCREGVWTTSCGESKTSVDPQLWTSTRDPSQDKRGADDGRLAASISSKPESRACRWERKASMKASQPN